jgi:hypothetical protein
MGSLRKERAKSPEPESEIRKPANPPPLIVPMTSDSPFDLARPNNSRWCNDLEEGCGL